MARFTFTSSGGAKALAIRIAKIKERIKDIRPALDLVHDQFIRDEKQLFATGGASGRHGAWKANALATTKRKKHSRVLRGVAKDGHKLSASCTHRNHIDHVFEQSANGVKMGTKHWKAAIHARGGGRLAKRRSVDPTFKQRRKHVTIISTYIVEGIDHA